MSRIREMLVTVFFLMVIVTPSAMGSAISDPEWIVHQTTQQEKAVVQPQDNGAWSWCAERSSGDVG